MQVIDLFAGAGGLSVGLESLGLKTALCIDNDHFSIETLKLNKRKHTSIIQQDLFNLDTSKLMEITNISNKDLMIVGGPPCQPFSKNSYWTEKGDDSKFRKLRAKGIKSDAPKPLVQPREDDRRFLIDVFAEAIRDIQPTAFIFENVASIMHPQIALCLKILNKNLRRSVMLSQLRNYQALEYGIPQKRERVFILGLKGKNAPTIPAPKYHNGKGERGNLLPLPKVKDALKKVRFKHEKGIDVEGRWADALKRFHLG